jgi:hypothetical protein
MGYEIETYDRESLRKIAIPGHAVTTLFWVLPLGRWTRNELDPWWHHFTEKDGLCKRTGLLIAKSQQRRRETNAGIVDLSAGANEQSGANLLDLIPESDRYVNRDIERRFGKKSLLVLSGAFPQPGWGVRIEFRPDLNTPTEFEKLLEEAARRSCQPSDLDAIHRAASAYHHRQNLIASKPTEPAESKTRRRIVEAFSALGEFQESILNKNGDAIDRVMNRAESLLSALSDPQIPELGEGWSDLSRQVRILRSLSSELERMDIFGLASLVSKTKNEEATEASSPRIDPKERALLGRIAALRKQWPELEIQAIPAFLAGPFREDLNQRVQAVVEPIKIKIKERLGQLLANNQIELNRYTKEYDDWAVKMRSAELDYRTTLQDASNAQWTKGPQYLIELEKTCSEKGLYAKSIPWDPARMVGWKLHAADMGVTPQDLLASATSILGTDMSQIAKTSATQELNGSIFADYAHYISITAPRFSPWQATKLMLSDLLGLPQLRKLLAPRHVTFDTGMNIETMITLLLDEWGWSEPEDEVPCSLATCIKSLEDQSWVLTKDLNPARISFEGFLKDLTRITLATLGWGEENMKREIPLHCPGYRRSYPSKPWKMEMEKINVGGAVILLEVLLPLAFPAKISKDEAAETCAEWNNLREALNSGSHHPPLPPPKPQELAKYAAMIHKALETAKAWIAEMPWHLTPSQSFGFDPTVVTGYAWSHSHPEDRLIRVMVSSDNAKTKSLVVWNKSLTNPVMTEAELV